MGFDQRLADKGGLGKLGLENVAAELDRAGKLGVEGK